LPSAFHRGFPRYALTPHQKREAVERRAPGDETLAEIGRSYNVSGWTISNRAPEGTPFI
jgi:hypothetical protein